MASQTFEDELMDVQSSLVSLCLEATEHVGREVDVRLVYIYASLEEGMASFNVFFRLADGSLPALDELVTDDDLYSQVCGLAYDDLDRLKEACSEFGGPCPTEVRGRYDAVGGGYTSRYSYEPKVGREDGEGQSPSVIFRAWLDAVAAGDDDLAGDGDGSGRAAGGEPEGAQGPETERAAGGVQGAAAVTRGAAGGEASRVADDSAYGGFVVSDNVLAGVPARFAFREPSGVADLNGWTVYSDADDDDYVNDANNFTVVTASTLARFAPALIDAFDAPYGTDIALLYDENGNFSGYWDNEGEREVSLEQVLAGDVRAS